MQQSMGSQRHNLETEQQFARMLLEAQERLQGVRPSKAARWRQSPRSPATPSLDAQLKPRWGLQMGLRSAHLQSSLRTLRGKLFQWKISNVSRRRRNHTAKAHLVSPTIHPCLPTQFIFQGNSQTSNHVICKLLSIK